MTMSYHPIPALGKDWLTPFFDTLLALVGLVTPLTGRVLERAHIQDGERVLKALTNVARHAQASRCRICLSLCDDVLSLDILDDGIGLPEELRVGVEMTSMRERAMELGGTFTVEARMAGGAREGTCVCVRLPLLPKE
jgi:hypothetical protein